MNHSGEDQLTVHDMESLIKNVRDDNRRGRELDTEWEERQRGRDKIEEAGNKFEGELGPRYFGSIKDHHRG